MEQCVFHLLQMKKFRIDFAKDTLEKLFDIVIGKQKQWYTYSL